MTFLLRTLVLSLCVAIPFGGVVRAQEDSTSGEEQEASSTVSEETADDLLEVMQEEIRLREELAAKTRDGVPASQLEALRGELDRLEKRRRALAPSDDSVERGGVNGEVGTDPAAGSSGGAEPPPHSWRFVDTYRGSYRLPLSAVLIAIFLRLAAGWSVRRWLAKIRAGLLKRESADDPRWRQAEDCILFASSLAILGGLLAVLGIEAGLLSGATVAILLALGLAVLWTFRRVAEDAIGGLTLLFAGSYQVGDMVDLADRSGVVETSSLFATTLRDMDGSVHFVPHRLVRSVQNSTYDWARAVVEVAVKPDEDLDRILSLLLEVAGEVAQSPAFAAMILEAPMMLGIESCGASQIVIRFFLKTAPRKRNMVKREVQRRVIQRFRELGIEIPLPAQALHHKIEKPSNGRGAAE